jgi:hypothetical protein
MARKKRKKTAKPAPTVTLSDTDAGVAWLASLTEPEFRDRVLRHVFGRMKKAGALEVFRNIHGRNDKGIDYIVAQRTPLSRTVLGIQAKAKNITRTGESATLSSVDLKTECAAALAHEFQLNGDTVRLDNVAIWSSAHITEDAEKEFYAPGAPTKIQVVRPAYIYSLIETYSPELLEKVPQCSLSLYLRNKAKPTPKAIKLLGKNLEVRKNFLIPVISKQPLFASSRLKTQNQTVAPKSDAITIEFLLETNRHALICGQDLSGKSYLLEHLQALAAERAQIPFLLTPADFIGRVHNIFQIFARMLPSFSPNDLMNVAKTQPLLLLMDDIDELGDRDRDQLLKFDPAEVKIIATARTPPARTKVESYYIVGVELDSIPPFLRSLDMQQQTQFTDRAHSFITRSLTHSGLPENPFTVAMLLQECQLTASKFSTPTMGRLIERFIELQLGSHSEEQSLVDFETKREFLTRLAGKAGGEISQTDLRKRLGKHVHTRSLPHDPQVFYDDLLQSGVFTTDTTTQSVVWAHPIIRQFFWVKNLISKGKLKPVEMILRQRPDLTLGAIVGSQLANAGKLIGLLAAEVSKLQLPSKQDLIKTVREMAPDIFPTDETEEKMLSNIEKIAVDPAFRREQQKKLESATSPYELTDEDRKRVEQRIGPVIQRVIDSKMHIGQNLASIVVNARDTKTAEKELAVREILLSNGRLGRLLQEVILLLFEGRKRVQQLASWLRMYMTLSHTDTLLGDPFLLPVFRNLLRKKLDDESYIMLLDLLLECGDENHDRITQTLRRINQPEITYAIYYRIVALYFFRFHREKDRKALRRLLKEIRKIHPFAALPTISAPA